MHLSFFNQKVFLSDEKTKHRYMVHFPIAKFQKTGVYIYISMYVYLDSFRSYIQTINAYFYFFATSSYFKFCVNTTDTQVAANEDYL